MAPLIAVFSCKDDVTGPRARPVVTEHPALVVAVSGSIATVSAGGYHTCTLKDDGSVLCWGKGEAGQTTVPVDLGAASQLSSGGFYTCALVTGGTVRCWGQNDFGQSNPPTDLTGVVQMSAGYNHACALLSDGTVRCWGSPGPQTAVPAGLSSVSQVSAGTYHNCALKADASVVCWGAPDNGQSTVPNDLTAALQISAGERYSCAIRLDRTVFCWGNNEFGQTSVPTDLTSVAQVSAGLYHACALKTDGTVVCWGFNGLGETSVPADLTSVARITTGAFHSCAIRNNGSVVCWGSNVYGQSAVPGGLDLTTEQPQTITFTSAAPAPAVVGYSYSIVAAGGPSGSPIVFSSLSSNVCSVSGNTATLIGAGTCTIAADQDAGLGYLVAPQQTQSFDVIEPIAQTISFTSTPPNPPIIGGAYTAIASGGGSGNAVVFSSLTAGTCSVSGSMVSFIAHGTCTIAANQSGTTIAGGVYIYLPASQATQTFVIDTRPVANAGGGQTGNEGTAVTFDGSASGDADGDALSYRWDFGDGAAQTTSVPTVTHVYNDNGNYVVTLMVTDAAGATSAPSTTSAVIANAAPTATFAPTSPAPEGPLTLSLTSVRDAAGDLSTLQYSFDCGDGLGFSAFASSPAFNCYAPDNGTLAVRAQVRDKDGAVSQYSASISLVNVAPIVTMISAPSTGSVGVDYTIQYRFTDPGTRDSPWYYQPNWGDGKKLGLTVTSAQGQTITQKYRYTSAGTYTVVIRVIDKDGSSGSTSFQVTIR